MNKNLKKRVGIIALSAIGSVALAFGATTAGKTAAADGAFETASIAMMKGASVRYYASAANSDESGIRFSAVIDSDEYQALEDLETENVSVSYGMLIAPYDYLKENDFNAATVFGVGGDKMYTWEGDTTENAAQYKQVAHVTYDSLIASKQKDYEGMHEIKGSLLKIKDANLTKNFVGKGYIKYEHDGVVEYKFASYTSGVMENNTRSIVYVSQLAIEANDEASEWVKKNYVEKVVAEDTTYSVATYVGDELVKTDTYEGVKVNQALTDVEVVEYAGFNNVSAETAGTVYANGNLVLKHVYEKDNSSQYQVKNGGFETGDLTDWTLTGNIGAVSSETHYWKNDEVCADGFAFGLDGTYMFSAYAIEGLEGNKGVLTSSVFTVGGSGWLTYKLGGAKNSDVVYVDVVEAETGVILKRAYNQKHRFEEVDGFKFGCELNAYKMNLSAYVGKNVYLRFNDWASSDFGLFFLDEVDALYLADPQGFTLANEVAHQNTIYDLYNGNFDNDMNGWTKSSNIGDISEATSDWFGAFDNEGKFFSCYAANQSENSTGTLRSNVFEVGGSGYITYRIGAVKNPDQVYMEVIDAVSGVKYGHFYNQEWKDEGDLRCGLISYKADLSAYIGKLVYINFVDNATGDYGLIFCDEFKTYYADVADIPEYNVAVNKVESVYNVMNGGFETGNLLGWTLVSGEVPGRVTDIDYFWNDANRVIGKDGNYSFTGVELNPDNGNLEGRIGTLRSSTFILKANSSISFKLGGCRSNVDQCVTCKEAGLQACPHVCIRIVNAETGEVIAWYTNPNRNDATLIEYTHVIGNTTEMACYIELVDEATDAWGLLGVDKISVFQA
ncbi:MAG: hypothetical protein IJX87_00770 [Clostridia bacterium]|nr:hypothetical protein [Clostridia bacterium]